MHPMRNQEQYHPLLEHIFTLLISRIHHGIAYPSAFCFDKISQGQILGTGRMSLASPAITMMV
jgi:hypothetical protein